MPRFFRKRGIYYCWGWLPDGTRWTRSTRERNKRAAYRRALDLERDELAAARAAPSEETPLAGALGAVLAWMESTGKAPLTIKNTRVKGAHIVRILGAATPLRMFEPPHGVALVEQYVTARTVGEGAGLYSVAMEVSMLRQAIRYAAMHGRFNGDTRHLAVPALQRAYRPRKRWLTEGEVAALLGAASTAWRDHVLAYIYLGARRRELFRITAADVEWARGLVHIRGTKTGGSDRWIPVHPKLRLVLKRRARDRVGRALFEEWNRVNEDLEAFCEKAKILKATCTDLRRTFGSRLINANQPLSVVRELMGHTSSKMIDLVYGQVSDEAKRRAIAALG